MNKHFENFIKTRPKKPWECDHDENHWCGNCINFGVEVEVKLPSGKISKGRIMTN